MSIVLYRIFKYFMNCHNMFGQKFQNLGSENHVQFLRDDYRKMKPLHCKMSTIQTILRRSYYYLYYKEVLKKKR